MEIKTADCPLGAKCEEVKTENGKQVLYRCPWYIQVRGNDVNTGAEIDNWACAIAWMPTLMINTANESRKGVAATESFRNEMVNQGEQTQKVMLLAAIKSKQLLEGQCE
jgi:hypothetical protein